MALIQSCVRVVLLMLHNEDQLMHFSSTGRIFVGFGHFDWSFRGLARVCVCLQAFRTESSYLL